MKTIKLSLNALATLCFLVLFMTGCQDDVVESELEPAASEEEAAIAEAQQILQDYVANSTFNPDLTNARVATEGSITYDQVTVSVFEEEFGRATENLIEQYQGPVTLMPVDSLPFITGGSSDFVQLYDGVYEATNVATRETERKQIAAIEVIDGDLALFFIADIPEGTDGSVVSASFTFGEDFRGAESGENDQGEDVFVEIDADVTVEDTPPATSFSDLSYDLSIDLQEFSSSPDDSVFLELEGVLDLEPEEVRGEFTGSFDATFTYTTSQGESGVANGNAFLLSEGETSVSLNFDDSEALEFLRFTTIDGISEQAESFTGFGSTRNVDGAFPNSSLQAIVEGLLIDPNAPEDPTMNTFMFDVTFSVFEQVGGGRGELIEQYEGTFTAVLTDEYPEDVDVQVTGIGEDNIIYDAEYNLTDSEGNTLVLDAAVVSIDGTSDRNDILYTDIIPNAGLIQGHLGMLENAFETTNPNGGILVSDIDEEEGSNNDFFVVIDAEPIAPTM